MAVENKRFDLLAKALGVTDVVFDDENGVTHVRFVEGDGDKMFGIALWIDPITNPQETQKELIEDRLPTIFRRIERIRTKMASKGSASYYQE